MIEKGTGNIDTKAGNGVAAYMGDNGPAASASLNSPRGLFVDEFGNLFIADVSNHAVRKVDVGTGDITTIAGDGFSGFSGDGGSATIARLSLPRGVWVNTFGEVFIADTENSCVRIVDTSGGITTFAGQCTQLGYDGDGGPAPSALLKKPDAVWGDNYCNVYIADTENYCVRKVDSSGIISTVAGQGTFTGNSGDNGPAVTALMGKVESIWVNPEGTHLLINDTYNYAVREVDLESGIITTVAGNGTGGFSGDGGQATAAMINLARGVCMVPNWSGDQKPEQPLLIADINNDALRKVDLNTGIITTLVDGLNMPKDAYVDPEGNIFITDGGNSCVKRWDADTGVVTVFAGMCGSFGYSGDGGPATSAKLNNPYGVAGDADGNIFISEQGNDLIRRVDGETGVITTFVSGLLDPEGIHADLEGNVYFSDKYNHCIKRKDAETGAVTVVAGICGSQGFTGDGGPATSARLKDPSGIFVDEAQNIFIGDVGNQRIRKVDAATQNITTVVEGGIDSPTGIYVDAEGNIYFSDRTYHCIKKRDTSTGVVTTIAGICFSNGYSGDGGPAASAELDLPAGIDLKEMALTASLERVTELYK
jgi:streptogramin lyase